MKAIITKNKDGMIVIDENGNQIQVSQNLVTRKKILFHYNEKFFNKFFNKYAPRIKGLSYQQINFILRKFWSEGTIGCFLRSDWKVIKDNTFYKNHPEEEIVFAPWVMYDRYNIYDYPIALTFINTRAVSFIPTTSFTIDENAVIGYIQRNKKSVFSSIEVKIAQLVDIEMTIRTNLKTQKYPWVIGVSPEDKEKLKNLFSQMEEDNPYIVAGFDDLKNSKAIVSGAPYTLDKLYQLKQAIENEILTILGVNNIGMLEKKEHAIVDEVNANNQEIRESGEQFDDCLKEFFDRIKKVLNKDVILEEEMLEEVIEEQPENPEDKEEEVNE